MWLSAAFRGKENHEAFSRYSRQTRVMGLMQLNSDFINSSGCVGKKKQTHFTNHLLSVFHLQKVWSFRRAKGLLLSDFTDKTKTLQRKSPLHHFGKPSICSGLPPYSSLPILHPLTASNGHSAPSPAAALHPPSASTGLWAKYHPVYNWKPRKVLTKSPAHHC